MKIYSMSGYNVVEIDELTKINKKNITWVKLTANDLERFDDVSAFTKIPVEDIKEFLVDDDEERARLEQRKFVKIIFRAPFLERGEITTQPLCIFTIGNLVLTIQKENIKTLTTLESKLDHNLMKFLFKGPSTGKFINHILDNINDEFFQSIERIPIIVRKIQSNDYNISKNVIKQMYSANITLSHFNQAIQANLDVLFSLRKAYTRQFSQKDKALFNDLYYDTLHLLDNERINRDIITNIFNFQSIIATNKINELFKTLCSYALIIAIPTLLSSIYGMNVTLPMQNNPNAFLILMSLMVCISLVLFLVFKKIDWI